jgi:hypothetical protein
MNTATDLRIEEREEEQMQVTREGERVPKEVQ